MNCQCFIKTKVCHVLKVLKRVLEERERRGEADVNRPILSLSLSACYLHSRGDDEPLFFD